jgi:hypothetical protein
MPRGFVDIDPAKLEAFLQTCGFGRRVVGKEVVYVRHNHHYHSVLVKVYTSLPADGGKARGAGKDAIRVTVAYENEQQPFQGRTSFGIHKTTRVFRSGTEQDVLDRLYERMREAYAVSNEWIRNRWHNLPKGRQT